MGNCNGPIKQSRATKEEIIDSDDIRKTLKKDEKLKREQNRNSATLQNDTDTENSGKRGNMTTLYAIDKYKYPKKYQLSYWSPVGV